ncbi:MAG: hypothetical protein WEH44_06875, partial [Pirellulaceae bacterium]
MRAAYGIALCCCAVFAAAHAAAQEASQPLFVKFGGQVRDEDRVIAGADSRGQPLKVLEEKAELVRVQLQSGAGWISRIDIGTREEVLKDASQRISNEPDNVELRLYRLELLSRASASDRNLALADLEHVIQLAPQDPRGYFLRG